MTRSEEEAEFILLTQAESDYTRRMPYDIVWLHYGFEGHAQRPASTIRKLLCADASQSAYLRRMACLYDQVCTVLLAYCVVEFGELEEIPARLVASAGDLLCKTENLLVRIATIRVINPKTGHNTTLHRYPTGRALMQILCGIRDVLTASGGVNVPRTRAMQDAMQGFARLMEVWCDTADAPFNSNVFLEAYAAL